MKTISFVLLLLLISGVASAMTDYKGIIELNNADPTRINQTLKLAIPYSTGMDSDFSNVAFYDDSGTLLKAFRMEYTASSTATYYVQVPEVKHGYSKIYIALDESLSTSYATDDSVFIFYDPLIANTTTFTQYTASGSNSVSYDTNGMYITGSGKSLFLTSVDLNSSVPMVLEVEAKSTDETNRMYTQDLYLTPFYLNTTAYRSFPALFGDYNDAVTLAYGSARSNDKQITEIDMTNGVDVSLKPLSYIDNLEDVSHDLMEVYEPTSPNGNYYGIYSGSATGVHYAFNTNQYLLTDWATSSGDINDATQYGYLTCTNEWSKYGDSIYFNGINGFTQTTYKFDPYDAGTDISFWINPSLSTYSSDIIFYGVNSTSGSRLAVQINSNTLSLYGKNSTGSTFTSSTTTFSPKTEYFIQVKTVSESGQNHMKFYVNNVLIDDDVVVGDATLDYFRLGYGLSSNTNYNGFMDELRINYKVPTQNAYLMATDCSGAYSTPSLTAYVDNVYLGTIGLRDQSKLSNNEIGFLSKGLPTKYKNLIVTKYNFNNVDYDVTYFTVDTDEVLFPEVSTTLNFSEAHDSYVVRTTIPKTSNIDSDFSNVKITNGAGVSLPFYVESTSTNSAIINVKLTNVAEGENQIYVYAGDSSMSSESSALKTYDFYDEFSELSTVKWDYPTEDVSVSEGQLCLAEDGVYATSKYRTNESNELTTYIEFNDDYFLTHSFGMTRYLGDVTEITGYSSSSFPYSFRMVEFEMAIGEDVRDIIPYLRAGGDTYNSATGTQKNAYTLENAKYNITYNYTSNVLIADSSSGNFVVSQLSNNLNSQEVSPFFASKSNTQPTRINYVYVRALTDEPTVSSSTDLVTLTSEDIADDTIVIGNYAHVAVELGDVPTDFDISSVKINITTPSTTTLYPMEEDSNTEWALWIPYQTSGDYTINGYVINDDKELSSNITFKIALAGGSGGGSSGGSSSGGSSSDDESTDTTSEEETEASASEETVKTELLDGQAVAEFTNYDETGLSKATIDSNLIYSITAYEYSPTIENYLVYKGFKLESNREVTEPITLELKVLKSWVEANNAKEPVIQSYSSGIWTALEITSSSETSEYYVYEVQIDNIDNPIAITYSQGGWSQYIPSIDTSALPEAITGSFLAQFAIAGAVFIGAIVLLTRKPKKKGKKNVNF
jgi:hypothetical protein